VKNDVGQEPLQGRAVGRASGIAPVIVAGPDQGPAGMGLAADIGLRGIMWASSELKSFGAVHAAEER
jgi:hypothetical protein